MVSQLGRHVRLTILIWLQFCSWGINSVPHGCNPNVDLLVVVDSSESIVDDDPYGKPLHTWNRMKSYLSGVINELPISPDQHRVAMVKYADIVHIEFLMDNPISESATTIKHHVTNDLNHVGGNTNTADVLRWSQAYLTGTKRPESKGVVLIFTDGMSRNSLETANVARDLKASGIEVFTVSMDNNNVDGDELYNIASSTQHRITAPDNSDNSAWEYSLNKAIYGICDLPVPSRDPFCDAILDIALIIDNSGSIKNGSDSHLNENYLVLKEFIKSLLDVLDIGATKTRVGAVRFSDHVWTEFKLDRYMDNRDAMKFHIDSMPFEGLRTNISGALKQVRSEIFNSNHGDRPNIPNVAIVIADGESNVDEYDTRNQARLLKADNTRIYVVAVHTQKLDKRELEYIASDPDDDHYFVSPTIKNLPTLKCNLLRHVCQETEFDECI